MVGFVVVLTILLLLMGRWHWQYREHEARIQQMRIRVHVNGIRGKSTVTRLIAGVLREGGFHTIAKTTGSAARVIHHDGNESAIQRKGAPSILEQIDIIQDYVTEGTEALVMECMAVTPTFQQVSQDQIVKGNIGVITNVREDHQDVMGDTLAEIADALSNTIPYDGRLIVAEARPELRAQLSRNARARGTELIYADPDCVTDEDLKGFGYLSFKENIACGLAVAQLFNIPPEVALRGMRKAIPDVGAVFVQKAEVMGKEIIWAPLFAANDRESTIIGLRELRPYHDPAATRIGMLNNRIDRSLRAIQFAEIAARDLKLDHFVTLGAYEQQVTARMVELGYPRQNILNFGDSHNFTLEEMLDQIVARIEGQQALLVGMVNIHTPKAELFMDFFHHLRIEHRSNNDLVSDLQHVSDSAQRRRYLISHLLKQR
jgi:poly-gamma-glutamate synthase PgsB/CapB